MRRYCSDGITKKEFNIYIYIICVDTLYIDIYSGIRLSILVETI